MTWGRTGIELPALANADQGLQPSCLAVDREGALYAVTTQTVGGSPRLYLARFDAREWTLYANRIDIGDVGEIRGLAIDDAFGANVGHDGDRAIYRFPNARINGSQAWMDSGIRYPEGERRCKGLAWLHDLYFLGDKLWRRFQDRWVSSDTPTGLTGLGARDDALLSYNGSIIMENVNGEWARFLAPPPRHGRSDALAGTEDGLVVSGVSDSNTLYVYRHYPRDRLDICNEALSHLKRGTIGSFNPNDSLEGKICVRYYEQVRRAVLSKGLWSTAKKQITLTTSSYAPLPSSWVQAYRYPARCLKFVRILNPYSVGTIDPSSAPDFTGSGRPVTISVASGAYITVDGYGFGPDRGLGDELTNYEIISTASGDRVILTNMGEVAYGEYIEDVEDRFDPEFRSMFGYRLAEAMGPALGASRQRMEWVRGMAEDKEMEARVRNANENRYTPKHRPSWLRRRG